MKQKLQGLIVGVLIGAAMTGSVVFATTGTKTIEVLYNNMSGTVTSREDVSYLPKVQDNP